MRKEKIRNRKNFSVNQIVKGILIKELISRKKRTKDDDFDGKTTTMTTTTEMELDDDDDDDEQTARTTTSEEERLCRNWRPVIGCASRETECDWLMAFRCRDKS